MWTTTEKNAEVMRAGHYHTGDVAMRDADGYYTYVGRADDVFKASDYRISPFELESVLIEHEAVAETAVVPSPDPLRMAVPKCFVTLRAGCEPSRELALSILQHARDNLAPYKRIRRLEFYELPKTISGKIRRVELRKMEAARANETRRPDGVLGRGFSGVEVSAAAARAGFTPSCLRIFISRSKSSMESLEHYFESFASCISGSRRRARTSDCRRPSMPARWRSARCFRTRTASTILP